jgi:hypothetical protein
MKISTFILLFYLIGMIFFPCSDALNECAPQGDKVEKLANHNHSTDANDICTPFCSCSCCHTVIDYSFIAFGVKQPKPEIFLKFTTFDFYIVSSWNILNTHEIKRMGGFVHGNVPTSFQFSKS